MVYLEITEYTWTCPKCKKINTEIDNEELIVICSRCLEEFTVTGCGESI